MFSIKEDMSTRFNEVRNIVDYIKYVENSTERIVLVPNQMVLKSSIVIMLYNVIESTITRVLSEVHDVIIHDGVKYYDLSKQIRNLMIVYYSRNREKNNSVHGSIDVIHNTIDFINGVNVFNLTYSNMIKFYNLYSGNLDAKQVRRVFEKYGIIITSSIGSSLKDIKSGRNSLAHGDISFEDYGRDLVISNLERNLLDVEGFLNEVISMTESFLAEKKYRI